MYVENNGKCGVCDERLTGFRKQISASPSVRLDT
jgi:hypothetical protein